MEHRWPWFDWIDPFGGIDDFPGFLVLLVVVAVLVAAVIAFPWLPALAFDLVDLLVFPVLAVVIVSWRVTRRYRFAIAAARDGVDVASWHVTGVRAARRIERAVADAICAGGDPAILFPEHAWRAVADE